MRGIVVPSADAFFLHIERTGAPQHVGGVVVLEPSDQRPTIDEVRKLVADGFAQLPRMHQRLGLPSRWRRPRWIEADDVDLEWHVIEHRCTDGYPGLLRYIGELAEQPMPRDRPMWRIAIVRDIGPDGSDGLVVLVHHSIADGIGTVLQTFSMFEPTPALTIPSGKAPGRLARAAAVTVGLAQLATDGTATRLPSSSLRRNFGTADIELDVVRRAAVAHGVRVTDLLIALLADSLYAVAPGMARSVGGQLRFSITTMVRTPDSAAEGNATAAIMVEVPVDGRPFEELLAEVSARTKRRLRRPTRALASRFVMTPGLRLVPEPFVRWFAPAVYGDRFLHAVVSNMPGPTNQMYFAGVPHHQVYPILPLVPGTPLAVGALSWTGVLGIGLATDPQLIDGPALAAQLNQSLARLGSGTGPLEGEEEARA
ncbi:WS/DGAT domain-containing protein [Kribbella sp. NBC_00709]|uniref:wax ester/triacylglycerol synthase domain-containing protein n=1 Tax=Kribbella sp. NBC_00709 TaxID=2975972 RepID=UPI002E2DE27B|nr:wax ester/triacylglycerol synthase domain-containing protein [Kribbella sp. NBC_00709]